MRPNFFIVGAAKAGTTSLYHYLEEHPEIGMASYKEPCHFCSNQLFDSKSSYAALFSHIPDDIKVIGEASTNYLAAPESPSLIKTYSPEAKIIIVVRHPVDRAFSLYKWMVRAGFEGAPTFEKALKLEAQRQNNKAIAQSPVKYNYNYFASGLYSEQINRYYKYFDKENILIINFDDLKFDLDNVLKKMYNFLGVNYYSIANSKIHNKAKFPFSPQIQYYLRNNFFNILNFKKDKKNKMFGNVVVDFLAGINSNLGKEPSLSRVTAALLQQKYMEDLYQLATFLPFSIEEWQKKY